MGHIFISHVERDAAIMQQIAKGLEAAGDIPAEQLTADKQRWHYYRSN